MSDELAFDDEGRDVAIEGTIASLPVKLERGVRFEFDVERVISPERARTVARASRLVQRRSR